MNSLYKFPIISQNYHPNIKVPSKRERENSLWKYIPQTIMRIRKILIGQKNPNPIPYLTNVFISSTQPQTKCKYIPQYLTNTLFHTQPTAAQSFLWLYVWSRQPNVEPVENQFQIWSGINGTPEVKLRVINDQLLFCLCTL